jgi:tetratricopeptide (TPR) repeat protein
MGTKENDRQPVRQARCVYQGDYWTLAFEARLIRLRDSKGLRQLALLLREPGREFHVLDLVARIDPGEIDGNGFRVEPEDLARLTVRSALGEDGGEPLDAQARAEYKQRLVELTGELEEARENHDEERIGRIEDEIDLVGRALKDSYGLGGRSRKARSAADQARVNVTKNIGRALDQIEAKHESLGRLLKSSIKTGIFCSYQPDPSFPVAWSFEAEQSSDAISSAEPDRPSGEVQLDAAPRANQLEHHGRHPAAGRLVWGQFIGRVEELAALRAAIEAALRGQASLVMLVGEPGIGKTRLAEAAGEYARRRGVQVLVGHCYEGEAASPYSSFVEAIREHVSTRPDDVLKAEMGDGAGIVAKLVPEIRKRISDLTPLPPADPTDERMRLFDSVVSWLTNASKANPIMLVLEDLHWADQASLQLLQHLARRFKGSRLVVVGTYRDVEVDRSHPLSAMLAELRRERLYERAFLRGLSEPEVKELIEAISQQEVAAGPGEEFVRAIVRETEGNPFFIEETLRHMVEIGSLFRREGRWVTDVKSIAEIGVPEGVREVIGRRLSHLSEATNRVLEAAAVLGREFEFEVLGRMNEKGDNPAWPAVEQGLGNRLVLESRGSRGPCYTFTHALVCQTLVEGLSLPRRQQLHLKAAQAIETVHERNLEPHVAALANHYRMGGASADAERTIDYSIRAGRAAYALFAYEKAGAHWRAALELMDERGGGDRKLRAELLRLLGDQLVSTVAKMIEYMEAAAPLYEELGDDQAACEVHSWLGIYLTAPDLRAMDLRRGMDHLSRAETLLPKQTDLSHVLFYLAMSQVCGSRVRIGDGLAEAKRLMETCERLGGEVGLMLLAAGEITSSNFLVSSGSVTDGLRLADQARQRAEPINNTMIGSTVGWGGGGNYFTLADPREAEDWYTHELAQPRTARSAMRRALLHHQLAAACVEMGELTKARAYLAEANAERKPEGLALFGDEASLLFFEGRWDLADKTLTAQAERARTTGNRREGLWTAGPLARLRMLTGERAQALQFLGKALEISVDGGDTISELKSRSTLAAMIADAGDAGEALPQLERCREIVGTGENLRGVAGSVERAEAVLAGAQREYSMAEAHFKKAIATFQRYCLPWEEADTLKYWGRALLRAGERARAIEKFDAAIQIYRSRGAGTRFIDCVMVDKTRTHDSKSTGPEA